MSPAAPKLSVVCPAFDEQEVLPLFHDRLTAALAPLASYHPIEVLYVDDGSRDGTLEVLRRLAADDPRVRYLALSRNFGHQAALTAGLEHARGEVVVSLDSDLQHPPELIPQLLAKWCEGFDVVITIREEDPTLGLFKRTTSRLFYRLMQACCDTEVRSAASDFRLLSRRAVDALLQLRERHRFVRGMVQWLGFRTAEVRFTPGRRGAGVSKYCLRRMFALACDGLLSFSKLPLRLALLLGLTALGLGLLCGLYAVVRAILAPQGFDPALTLLLFITLLFDGATLCGLGVVGEYVGRIHDQVQQRPIYLVQESSDDRPAAYPFPVGREPQQPAA